MNLKEEELIKLLPGKVTKIPGKDPDVKIDININRFLFQTWKTRDNIPEHWIEGQEAIKVHMGGWYHIITDDNDNRKFIQEHYPKYLEKYDSFQYPIQRADYIRGFLLYKFGGVYLDLDTVIQKPLDDLFTTNNDVYLVMSGNVTSCATNSFMAGVKGSKFWEDYFYEMTDAKLPWYTIFGKHWQVLCSTGPIALNRALKRTNSIVGLLPGTLLMPCNVCNMETTCDSSKAYIRPLIGTSWNPGLSDTNFYNYVICNTVKFIIIVILIVLLIILLIYLGYTW